MIGAAQQRKLQKQAAELAQKGVGELQGGTGYDPSKALEFLGLTDKSAYEDQDPVARAQSMEALNKLVERGSGSGLDIQSRDALSQAAARAGGAQHAARQAILQEYLNKGGEASGGALAAALQGQQASYGDMAAQTGSAAAAAEQRRLEANVLAARAGQGQQGIDQAKAAAIDALRRFNVGAKQGTLGLEADYRKGAADVYQGAGRTMAGLAGQPSPMAGMGQGAQALAGIAQTAYGMTQGQPSAGAGTGWDAQGSAPNLGNWSLQQPSAPANYTGSDYQIPETKLKPGAW
jgi:hypothetical protein